MLVRERTLVREGGARSSEHSAAEVVWGGDGHAARQARGAVRRVGHAAAGALCGEERAGRGFHKPSVIVLCRCTYRWKERWRAAMAKARVSPVWVLPVLKL